MKRQFMSLRNRKSGSRVRLRVGKVLAPDNARKTGTFKSNVAFENWFKMVLKFDIYKLITLKTCVHFYYFLFLFVG